MSRQLILTPILLIMLVMSFMTVSQAEPVLGLTVQDGVVMHEGKPFRGIGVNYFDAFYLALIDENSTAYETGFAQLAEAKIPFARLCGCGFWPKDMKLYMDDPEGYWQCFDKVVRAAEEYGIGLIPSMFWNTATVPDLVGEPVSFWGDRNSKTHAFMRKYVQEMVTRYKDSPAIWGWEFSNEFNLGANLPNASEHRPPTWTDLGNPATRSELDDWTYEIIREAYAAFGEEVRKYDPDRIISTGDGFPRTCAWHNWKEKSWDADSPEQFAQMLTDDNPDPISVISVHSYGQDDLVRLRPGHIAAQAAGKPLFVGEFGDPGPREKSEPLFRAMLDEIVDSGISLAAVWVFGREGDDEWNVAPLSERVYQLQAISEANEKLQAQPVITQPAGSLDMTDGRRLMGWVRTTAPGQQAVEVGFFINREAAGDPDFITSAAQVRPDLQELGIHGFGFSATVPREFRSGETYKVTAAVRDTDNNWVVIPGSAREFLFVELLSVPELVDRADRKPIPVETELWYGGEDVWAMPVEDVWAAFSAEGREQWRFVQQNVQAIALHNNTLAKANLEQMREVKSLLEENKLKLVLEIGGLEQWQAGQGDRFGEASAEQEIGFTKLWWTPEAEGGCGGTVDYIILDDPIYRGLFPRDKDEARDLDMVANEIADAIGVWQKQFPNIKPVLGSNFPNWGWKNEPAYFNVPTMKGTMCRGDYYPALLQVVEILQQRGVQLHGLILDNPYDYVEKLAFSTQPELIAPLDFIARLRDVEDTARSLNLKFGLYMNTDLQDLEPEGLLSLEERDHAFYNHVHNFFECYREAGGEPDFWSTYSWMKSPTKLIPETENYTQSWNMVQFIEQLRKIKHP